jgi:hypothetical protein
MKAETARLFKRFDSTQIKGEVEAELRFHLELLTEALLQQDMSPEEANAAARERFGNLEQIKDQCVEISTRNSPLKRALKSFLILAFLVGVLVRVFSTEYHVLHVGDTLIAVGILGRLLLYVRGLNPSSFISSHETLSPLILNEKPQTSLAAYDQRKRTPVERVISDQ